MIWDWITNKEKDKTEEYPAVEIEQEFYEDYIALDNNRGVSVDNDENMIGLSVWNSIDTAGIQMSVEQARELIVLIGKAIQDLEDK